MKIIPTPSDPPVVVRPHSTPPGTFPAASLLGWLQIAARANVRAIPARVVEQLPIEDLLRFDQGTAASEAACARLERLNHERRADRMLRWDPCAGLNLKLTLSQPREDAGLPQDPEELRLDIGDPRAFDILYAFPAPTVAIVERPWVPALQIDGFPVEFRVFLRDGAVAGIANYYCQRSLTRTPDLAQWAARCVRASQAMVEALAWERQPWMPGQPVGGPAQGTLDFLVDAAGELWLLEGGPGWGFGAHPCAFLPTERGGAMDPWGVAWASGVPAEAITTLPAP